MWEATARESPSLLEGTNYHLGNFDECVVPIKRNYQNGPDRQYCLVTINIKFDYPRNFSDKQAIFDPYGSSLNIIYVIFYKIFEYKYKNKSFIVTPSFFKVQLKRPIRKLCFSCTI